MLTGPFHVLWGQNLTVYDVDPVCVRVCFGLPMSYCGLLHSLMMEMIRSMCTDSPSCSYTRPVELRTGCESNTNSNLVPWATK